MAGNTTLPGYPLPVGTKYRQVFDHAGPVSYSQATGDAINASDLGFGGIDSIHPIFGGVTLSGTYQLKAYYTPTLTAGNASPGTPQKVLCRWYVVAGGAEVANAVNLSGELVRLDLTLV